uniref:Uncharacterized protein n=1 Tax=Romanomermis culicivorax TaxID=13658 RepID=A0A915ILU7_ROMCU
MKRLVGEKKALGQREWEKSANFRPSTVFENPQFSNLKISSTDQKYFKGVDKGKSVFVVVVECDARLLPLAVISGKGVWKSSDNVALAGARITHEQNRHFTLDLFSLVPSEHNSTKFFSFTGKLLLLLSSIFMSFDMPQRKLELGFE